MPLFYNWSARVWETHYVSNEKSKKIHPESGNDKACFSYDKVKYIILVIKAIKIWEFLKKPIYRVRSTLLKNDTVPKLN